MVSIGFGGAIVFAGPMECRSTLSDQKGSQRWLGLAAIMIWLETFRDKSGGGLR